MSVIFKGMSASWYLGTGLMIPDVCNHEPRVGSVFLGFRAGHTGFAEAGGITASPSSSRASFDTDQSTELSRAAYKRILGRSGKPMPDEITARLRGFLGKSREGHDVHAPFRVTTHRGHTVQTFQSLELALEAAEALGPDHYVTDRRGLQIWNPERKLLRNEE